MPISDSCSFFKKPGKIAAYTACGAVVGGLAGGAMATVLAVPGPAAPVIAPALILPFIAGGAVIGGVVGFSGAVCYPRATEEHVFSLS